MSDEARDEWRVAWSWQAPSHVAGILQTTVGLAVSCDQDIIMLDDDGSIIWRRRLPFRTFSLASAGGYLGVLAGHGFHVLDIRNGVPLHEGRATSGGFSQIRPRQGGGWVLSDRKEHLHLFNDEGRGIRRLRTGTIRSILGWFDREHLLVHDEEGYITCIRMVGEDSIRRIEDRAWSWVSNLEDGLLIMQAPEGGIWEGIPHPYGWDVIDKVEKIGLEPLHAQRAVDGWWLISIDGSMYRLPPIEDGSAYEVGDLLTGDGQTILSTSTRDGLIRRWEAPEVALHRRRRVQAEVARAREDLDWENRRLVFQAAREAEDSGQLSRAAELYQKLGRRDDVRRILRMKKEDV